MAVVSADISLSPTRAPGERNSFFRSFRRRHRIALLATVPTLPLYAVWAAFLATGGGDLAAQEAWARFASEHGTAAYNLFWYGGMHTANYSLISPYLMAALGVRTVTVLSGVAGAWLVAALIARSGIRRPLWPAVLASLAVWCNVASGRTTFALGLAFGLAACLALVRQRRTVLAVVCAALATMGSPVAGLFLVVAGAGCFFVRDWVRAAALIVPPFVVVAATTVLFPFTGEHLMPFDRIFPPVLFSLALIVAGPREWRAVRWAAGVYAAGTVLTYLIPSPIGTNVERLAELVGPALLLAALLAPGLDRVRRIVLTVALVLSSAWVAQKTYDDLVVSTKVPKWAVDTHGVVRELERLGADRTRVEVVPARNHREATALAPYVNMARGWNRQLDIERGRLFYDGSFSAGTYREWLDKWAVGYVVLPAGKPDGYAEDEAALVASGPAWLKPVWKDAHWRIYRVEDPVPLVSRPAAVVRSTGADVVVRVPKRGSVTVRLVYSPWLRAEGACLKPRGEFTELSVPAPGTYEISSGYGPSRGRPSTCR
ncbi:glycosyltransferase family 87 protein [Streptomyces silaceus]|uniref:glycosyltransferase family 87 protein n=1 Tax=Streptomyces silaceus TaxID=545123 RepID=UPI0006EB9872|nr:glycosyltransferase family 87 protein [Streptomyces silaceus]